MTENRSPTEILTQLVNDSPLGLILVDSSLRLVELSAKDKRANPRLEEFKGRLLRDLLDEIWSEQHAEEVLSRYQHTLETGEAFSSSPTVERRRDTDNTESWQLWLQRVSLTDSEYGVLGYFIDLSERYRWETSLQKSQSALVTIVDNIPVGLMVITPEPKLVSINPAALELLDAKDQRELERSLQESEQLFEIRYPDGRPVPQGDGPAYQAMKGNFVRGQEMTIRRKSGGKSRHVSVTTLPLNTPGEKRILLVVQDLTRLRESERERRLLSNPILPISRRVILLPLVGALDDERIRQMQTDILECISKLRAGVLVIDVTGLVKIDTSAAGGLITTIKAARLQGAKTILCGISEELSNHLVQLQIHFDTVYTTTSTLEMGLQIAQEIMGEKAG